LQSNGRSKPAGATANNNDLFFFHRTVHSLANLKNPLSYDRGFFGML
jgi:hypothetical protein